MTDSQTKETKDRWLGIAERAIPLLLTIVIPVAGGLWAIFTYTQSQADVEAKRAAEQLGQNRARIIELQKPFIEQQFHTYNGYVNLIGDLISMDPRSLSWRDAETEFWKQHWSRLALVEDEDVHETKKPFGDALTAYRRKLDEKRPVANKVEDLEDKFAQLDRKHEGYPATLQAEKDKLAEPMNDLKKQLDALTPGVDQAHLALKEASVPLTTALRRSIQKSWAGQLGNAKLSNK